MKPTTEDAPPPEPGAADVPVGDDAPPGDDALTGDAEILDGIAAVAREHLDYAGPLDPGMRLVEDLELDSIRLLTLAVEVENRFRVCLDEEDDRGIETVGDLVAVVRRELARSPATQP